MRNSLGRFAWADLIELKSDYGKLKHEWEEKKLIYLCKSFNKCDCIAKEKEGS
jgi:hypothetical protein